MPWDFPSGAMPSILCSLIAPALRVGGSWVAAPGVSSAPRRGAICPFRSWHPAPSGHVTFRRPDLSPSPRNVSPFPHGEIGHARPGKGTCGICPFSTYERTYNNHCERAGEWHCERKGTWQDRHAGDGANLSPWRGTPSRAGIEDRPAPAYRDGTSTRAIPAPASPFQFLDRQPRPCREPLRQIVPGPHDRAIAPVAPQGDVLSAAPRHVLDSLRHAGQGRANGLRTHHRAPGRVIQKSLSRHVATGAAGPPFEDRSAPLPKSLNGS